MNEEITKIKDYQNISLNFQFFSIITIQFINLHFYTLNLF